MGLDYEKRIYFIGGYLDKAEVKKDFEKYRAMLDKVWINESVRDMDLLRHPIISVPQCTKEKLEWIWKDKHTYGIIWYSHGDQDNGYPLAYHSSIDDQTQHLSNEEKISFLVLDPKKIWKPGPNLKFVAFQSCYSQKLHDEWQKKLPGIQIKTHAGKLSWTESAATNVPVDQMKMWINEDKGRFKSAKPTDGVRYLFRYLIDVSKTPPDSQRGVDTPVPGGAPDAGVPDGNIRAPDAGPSDSRIRLPAGVPVSQKISGDPDTDDLSDRIKILPDTDEQHEDYRLASVVPDLSDRIKILPDTDEQHEVGYRLASVVPGLSDRIKILPDTDEQEPFQPFAGQSMGERYGADQLRDTGKPFQPFAGQSMGERYGADQLRDTREPFNAFADKSPFDRYGADQLRDTREPFNAFADKSPFDRYGADQLRDSRHDEREPFNAFADKSPFDRYGADQLRDTGKPFQPFANQQQWMNQGIGGPPHIASQVDLRPHHPFTDKPQWKT